MKGSSLGKTPSSSLRKSCLSLSQTVGHSTKTGLDLGVSLYLGDVFRSVEKGNIIFAIYFQMFPKKGIYVEREHI